MAVTSLFCQTRLRTAGMVSKKRLSQDLNSRQVARGVREFWNIELFRKTSRSVFHKWQISLDIGIRLWSLKITIRNSCMDQYPALPSMFGSSFDAISGTCLLEYRDHSPYSLSYSSNNIAVSVLVLGRKCICLTVYVPILRKVSLLPSSQPFLLSPVRPSWQSNRFRHYPSWHLTRQHILYIYIYITSVSRSDLRSRDWSHDWGVARTYAVRLLHR